MRIAVVAAGGVGGYFGTRLAVSGDEVTFVARGRHLEAIREHGLLVRSPPGEFRVPAESVVPTIGDLERARGRPHQAQGSAGPWARFRKSAIEKSGGTSDSP
ncbi:2-dehydropantoate 2-reductase N-terminal domain-containing protein [Streptomyces sp. NPDC054933]